MENINTVYVKAMSAGEWFGGWAPVKARLEWMRTDRQVALFTLTEPDLDEDDEYEFFQPDTQVLAVLDGDAFKAIAGLQPDLMVKGLDKNGL